MIDRILQVANPVAGILAASAALWALFLFIWERRPRLLVLWGRGDVPSVNQAPPDWHLVVNFEVANGSSTTEELLTRGSYVEDETGEEKPLKLFEINDLHPASGEGPLLVKPTTFGAVASHSVRTFRLIYKPLSKFKARSFKVSVSSKRGQCFTWTPQT